MFLTCSQDPLKYGTNTYKLNFTYAEKKNLIKHMFIR